MRSERDRMANSDTLTVKHGVVAVIAGLLVVSALGMVSMSVLAQAQEANEPNNTRETATPIEDGEISGTVSSGNDSDWYSFQATEGETISILITKPVESADLLIYFYAPDVEDLLFYKTVKEGDTRAQIVFTAQRSGTHYIEVMPQTSGTLSEGGDSYTIHLLDNASQSSPQTPSAGPQQEIEPNDAYETATAIQDTNISGEISVKGDSDWYSIQATEGENVSFALRKPVDKPVLAMALYAPNGSQIANDTAFEGVGKAQVSVTANQTGTYSVVVVSDFSSSNIPYTLYTPASAAPENVSMTVMPTATATVTPMGTPAETSVPVSSPTPSKPPTLTKTEALTDTVTDTQSPTPSTTAQTKTQSTSVGNNSADNGTDGSTGATSSENASDRTTTDGNTSDGSSMFGPGFGPVVAVIALLAAALLAVRHQ